MHRLFQPMLNALCTKRFACSDKAGKWLYGNRRYEVIINAIRLEDFAYDEKVRKQMREKEGLDDSLVIGHIGNLLPVKNHLFMLDVMKVLVKKRPDCRMIFHWIKPITTFLLTDPDQFRDKCVALGANRNQPRTFDSLLRKLSLLCWTSF